MGFLQWLAGQNDEGEGSESALSNRTQASLEKKDGSVDASVVNQMFRDSIHNSGGDGDAQRDCSVALSEELFDMRPKRVYEETGGKPYDRKTLPPKVQAAWLAGEVVATEAIEQSDIYNPDQEAINLQLAETTRVAGRSVRRWLPW
jgi:hypothetical protein